MNAIQSIAPAAALILPLLVAAALLLHARRARRVAMAFAGVGGVPWVRMALALAGALAISGAILAAASAERAGDGVRRGGGAVVLVLDVSNSMLTRDVGPDRLTHLKSSARSIVTRLAGTPVGIVVFAGRAYALSPPTTDPEALDLYLSALDPQMVTQTGTSLSAAVRQSVGLLTTTRERAGSVVLISDGNAQETPADLDAATGIAERAGVRVYTVGIGTPAGGPVPKIDYRTGQPAGYIPDPTGGPAISRLDEALLRRIASQTGGDYIHAPNPTAIDALAGVLAGAGSERRGGDARLPLYLWFTGAALLLLLLEFLPLRRRSEG